LGKPGEIPVVGTRYSVGFRPYIPQKWEGMRIDPPRSFPISREVSPAATAAAPPPVLPPEFWIYPRDYS